MNFPKAICRSPRIITMNDIAAPPMLHLPSKPIRKLSKAVLDSIPPLPLWDLHDDDTSNDFPTQQQGDDAHRYRNNRPFSGPVDVDNECLPPRRTSIDQDKLQQMIQSSDESFAKALELQRLLHVDSSLSSFRNDTSLDTDHHEGPTVEIECTPMSVSSSSSPKQDSRSVRSTTERNSNTAIRYRARAAAA